jgi:glycosyltransferase involved in cell wall biosynthesis
MANETLSTSKSPQVTAIIIAKNEEKMIANCIETLRWCSEIRVVDTGSDDRTAELAERLGVTVIHAKGTNFSEWRNEASKNINTEWVFYVDADERVTPALAKTIQGRLWEMAAVRWVGE